MRLAFLMPSEANRRVIGRIRESVIDMRPDQLAYLEHLLRSWRVFGCGNAEPLIWRAIKRTLRERP